MNDQQLLTEAHCDHEASHRNQTRPFSLYPQKASFGLGITQLVIGILSVMIQVQDTVGMHRIYAIGHVNH